MEQLNKVELRGIIGSVRVSDVGDRKCIRMTVATNLAYKGADGCAVIETTWHNVLAFEGGEVCGAESLSKGDHVNISGRIRNVRYTSSEGKDMTASEIYATRVSRIVSDEPFLYQY